MRRRHAAFLLRRWQLSAGQERVEVQFLASGEVRRFRSLAEASAWIEQQEHAEPPGIPREPSAPAATAPRPPPPESS